MKRFLVIALALMLALAPFSALAEELVPIEAGEFAGDFDEPQPEIRPITSEEFGDFVVGATTRLSGDFSTDMWGNNTCDIDVRSLLHGYETVYWAQQPMFNVNPTVIEAVSADVHSDGNKVYTLTVAKDLMYNDGTPITARDYVFTYLLHSAPEIAAIGGAITNYVHIAGYESYAAGETETFSGVRLIDEYTFSVELKGEYLPFFFELSMIEAIPYPISVIAPGCEVADEGQGALIRNIDQDEPERFTAETLQATMLDPDTGYLSHPMVTSGPWQLQSFDWETREVRVTINPNFKGNWEGQKPTIDNIVFHSVLPVEMMGQLEAEEVHLLNKVVYAEDINAGLQLPGTGRASYPRLGYGFLNFSCEMGPCQSEAVRQAIAYAIDVEGFDGEFVQQYGSPVYGYYGLGQWMVQMLDGMIELEDATEEAAAAWEELSLDELNHYEANLETAKQLLIDDGWTLNERGEPFDEAVDAVRAKEIDGELMVLNLKYARIQDSVAAEQLEAWMVEPLAQIGIAVETTELPFVELLEHYYRQSDRTYDLMYLATNFISVFDPYFVFHTGDEYQNHFNTSGLKDEELQALALEMRRTQPGAYLEYTQKWLAFQKAYNEKLPQLPLYGNIYFDFHTDKLQNYHPDSELYDWPVALLYATLGELINPVPDEEPLDAPDGAGEIPGDDGLAMLE